MPQLVRIGAGRQTHYRADGTGPVPAGRARCELSQDGNFAPYVDSEENESETHPEPPGQPTCWWCLNRTLPE
jgi:hypothetical protein